MIRHLLILTLAVAAAGCASSRATAVDRAGYQPTASLRNGPDSPGWQSMAEGDPRAAQADFDNALQINPFDPIALNNVAVAKSENGQYHEAVALLERANRLAPENTEIAANLSRMRSYVNTYALQSADVGGTDSVIQAAAPVTTAQSGLPPPPPPLWSTLIRGDTAAQQQSASYYYDGCTSTATATSKRKRKTSAANSSDCR
jgi:tetratricopeptide (TPR) repeat protein